MNAGSARSIRLVVRNYFPVMHNMHLHGTRGFWVLAEGTGIWDGTITNPRNPQRRDGHQMGFGNPEEPTFMVLQWNTENPGMWPFHCHLSLHSSAGLITNILVGTEAAPKTQISRWLTSYPFIATTRLSDGSSNPGDSPADVQSMGQICCNSRSPSD